MKNDTSSEVLRLEAALAATRLELEAVLNETNNRVALNAMDAEASRSSLASAQTDAEKELPTFLAVTAIVSTLVSILISIIVGKCNRSGGGGGGDGSDSGKYDSPHFVANKAYDPEDGVQGGGMAHGAEGYMDVDESQEYVRTLPLPRHNIFVYIRYIVVNLRSLALYMDGTSHTDES